MSKLEKKELVSTGANFQTLGFFIRHPEALDTHKAVVDDFYGNTIHQYIFTAVSELYNSGYHKLDTNIITDYIDKHHSELGANNIAGIRKFIANAKDYTYDANFEASFKLTKNYSLLRALNTAGFDVTEFYDPTDIDPDVIDAKRAKVNELTASDIQEYYSSRYLEKLKHVCDKVRINTNTLPIFDPMELPEADTEEDVIVEGMMYAHTLNNITGQSKAGKSFLGFQLAYCIQNGIEFLGHKCNKTDVLYVDFELRPKSIKDRCKALCDHYGLEESENFKVMSLGNTWGNGNITLDSIVETIRKYKVQNPNLGVCVLDPFYRFNVGEENKAEDVMQTLTKLKSLTKDMTVLYVHHTNKMGAGNNPINAGSGSGVHGRAVDQTYVLTAKKDGYEIINTGRDFYNDKMICTRDDTGYFDLEDAEMQAEREEQSRHCIGGKPVKKVVTKEELKDKYPDICNYIDEHTLPDGYGCTWLSMKKALNLNATSELTNKGFKFTGKNRNKLIPSGRIMYP